MRPSCRTALLITAASILLTACAESLTGLRHGPIRLIQAAGDSDSVVVGKAGSYIASRLSLMARYADGVPVMGGAVSWTAIGHGAAVRPTASITDEQGEFSADWMLGDLASEPQYLIATVTSEGQIAEYTFQGRAEPGPVNNIVVPGDTVTVRLGVPTAIPLKGVDEFGNPIETVQATLAPQDTNIVVVSNAGEIVGRKRGTSYITVASGAVVDTVTVRVVQVVAALNTTTDTIRFNALGDTQTLSAILVDDAGLPVQDSLPIIDLSSAPFIAGGPGLEIRSLANGSGMIKLVAGSVSKTIPVVVHQVPAHVAFAGPATELLQVERTGDPVAVTCNATDHNGATIPDALVGVTSKHGIVAAATCSRLSATMSGVDTLQVATVTDTAVAEIAIAIRATPVDPRGVRLDANIPFDSLNQQWAPTAVLNPDSTVGLYYAAYLPVPGDTLLRADLHRLVSTDRGLSFQTDGLALTHDASSCDPDGWGIENIAIAQRAEAPGYRMFYSSGSTCLGWRVRSAVSADGRTWTREDGTRVGDPTGNPAYSAGEGISVMRLANGGWRMWVGTFVPGEGFAIEDWHSPDQLTWTRHARIFSPLSFPGGPMYAVYSPSVVQIGPSMWRMYFCADDRNQPNGRSRLYSAVSRDLESWTFEGEFMSQPDLGFWYATVAGDELYFIRQGSDKAMFLSRTQIVQP